MVTILKHITPSNRGHPRRGHDHARHCRGCTVADSVVCFNMDDDYEFTNDWFVTTCQGTWSDLLPLIKPSRILEIGTYEGRATCWLIDNLAEIYPIEIHCVDTWLGGTDHDPNTMPAVEQRFLRNIHKAKSSAKHTADIVIHRGASVTELARLIADGKQGYFDFIYIDGSHQAPDVMSDAVLSWHLLREGGVMAFDDYSWMPPVYLGTRDVTQYPRPAIDAFTALYSDRSQVMDTDLAQRYVIKQKINKQTYSYLVPGPYGGL